MWTLTRILATLALACSAALAVVAAPAHAAPTITVANLTVFPQVGGELTIGATVTAAPAPSSPTLERWVPQQGWLAVPASVRSGPNGDFYLTVALDAGPLAHPGGYSLRVLVPGATGEPPTPSPAVGVFVFNNAVPPFDSAPSPTVTGTHRVGATLHAAAGSWSPEPALIGFRWNRDGVQTDVTGPSYPLTSADVGTHITVSAVAFPRSGTASGFTVRDSRPTARVTRGTFTAPAPELVGSASLGGEVRVDLTGWAPTPTTLSYRWLRDDQPIDGGTGARHTITPADAGARLSVAVRAEAAGVDPVEVRSRPFDVPADAGSPGARVGDLMAPASSVPWPPAQVSFTAGSTAPPWSAGSSRTRWDTPGAFTHSQEPVPFLTLSSVMYGQDWARAANGAEYTGTNASLKNADVSFTITARRFAIAYRGTGTMDAMVWLDGRPITRSPIVTTSPGATTYTPNWITVELPARRTTTVRFAGPASFTGIDVPAGENAVIAATAQPLDIGVVSDSLFDVCADALCHSRSAAPTLSTLTGFRVWNLAEGGTGYLSASGAPGWGSYVPSPFGSARRLAALARAPIDLLLVNGSMNDASVASYSPEAHRAAVHAYLTEVARIRPDLPVVLVGIEPIGRYQSRYWDDRGRAMTENLASMVGRHQNVIGFIDPYTDRWLTGTGSIIDPRGDGNQDQYVGTDGVHLGVAGVAYYVGRMVEELAELRLR